MSRAPVGWTLRVSGAAALAGVMVCRLVWGWAPGIGLALGWAAGGGSLAMNAHLTPGVAPSKLRLRLLGLAFMKWPVLILMVYFAGRLGVAAAAGFVVGACSVYLALAAGAIRSLRSRE